MSELAAEIRGAIDGIVSGVSLDDVPEWNAQIDHAIDAKLAGVHRALSDLVAYCHEPETCTKYQALCSKMEVGETVFFVEVP